MPNAGKAPHEPKSRPAPTPPQFVVGQDAEGHWIAINVRRGCGGIFADRAAALKYAAAETNHCAKAVRCSKKPLKLWV